jgi:3'-phosphoadenosine 5'-phosphosulfate sulfotransferase (PAPS reductase)/FAD synthetase
MKILSLGWGIQSTTLAFMVALGELEPVDFAIHADTTHESSLTYDFARRWTPWLEERGVKVVTVKPKHNDPLDNGYGQEDPPYYTLNIQGEAGQGKRQCTTQWKIAPMRRWLYEHHFKRGVLIEQWIGISLDEFQRMKDTDVKYITNRWPLIERHMTRADCVKWLEAHALEVPPKSACTFCPFHSTDEWRRIKANPADWQEAVAVDEAIRKARPPYDLFVHPSRKPLADVDLRTAEEKGQLALWDAHTWDAECSGICGV